METQTEKPFITYSYKQIGLYGYEDIQFDESKEEILENFKDEYEDQIKEALKSIGIYLKDIQTYSPKAYNFENDTIDLQIYADIDKTLFKEAILKHKEDIQKDLNANKSYDGYIALTVKTIDEELENLDKLDYEPDIIVLISILNKLVDTSSFEYTDYLVFEQLEYCDTCKREYPIDELKEGRLCPSCNKGLIE